MRKRISGLFYNSGYEVEKNSFKTFFVNPNT